MKYKVFFLPAIIAGLTACGGESSDSSQVAGSDAIKIVQGGDSALAKFTSDEAICDALGTDKITSAFGAETEIKAQASSYRERFTCNYSWDRPDAEERQQKMISSMMAKAQGKGGATLSMREKTPSNQISLTIAVSKRAAENFVPRKLTEEQLQAQIDAAQKRTQERLSDEQKAVAGDMASSFTESLLKKNNQNEEVKGVGDAAFWSKVGFGALNVHSNGMEINIAPMIADTEEADIENAKRIFDMLGG
ncbi:MAG: hypothetical protein AB8B48_15025 [Pseudomonadales bacterium]